MKLIWFANIPISPFSVLIFKKVTGFLKTRPSGVTAFAINSVAI